MYQKSSAPFRGHKLFLAGITVVAVCGLARFTKPALAQDTVYMFSYFKSSPYSDGNDGLHLAYSLDGYNYHAVNGDVAITGPMMGTTTRDPYIINQNGVFRLFHTTLPWSANTKIAYGESTDLLTWTNSKYIDVMAAYPSTNRTWAPQCYWDATNSQYMIYWSGQASSSDYFKIYYTTTTDFTTFSATSTLFDYGSTKIDADIVKDGSNYVMFLADISKSQGGTNLYSGYSTSLQRITNTSYAAEGPSSIKIGDTWIVYNDHYTTSTYGAVTSTDLTNWTEATTRVAFPYLTRHGNVFTVSRSVAEYLVTHTTSKSAEDEFVGDAGTSDFNTAANWFSDAVPGANQTPVIQRGNTVNMTSSPSGTFSGLQVGITSTGTLNITNAAVSISSSWPNGLIIGGCTQGTGTVVQSGSSSSVSISGFASIGKYGTGTYRLQGGTFSVTGDLNLGDIRGGHGYLYVEGGTLTAPTLYIGSGYDNSGTTCCTGNAVGEVHQSGGTVTVSGSGDYLVIGGRDNNVYGVGSYDLSGGTLSAGSNANVLVGKYGQGTFTQSGGTFNAAQWIYIGRYSGSSGSYSISGGTLNQTSSSRRLCVGYGSTGSLTVSGTGYVNLTGGLRITSTSTGNGEVHLDGGTIFTPLVEDSGGTSAFHFNGGTLKAKNATTTFMQGLNSADIEAGGAIIDTNGYNITIAQSLLAASADGGLTKNGSGTLTLSGTITYTGDTLINDGTLQLLTGTTTLDDISGAGQLLVGSDTTATQLTVSSISLGALSIGPGSKLIINGSAEGLSDVQLSTTPVPEPSLWLLLVIAAAAAWLKRR